MTVNAFDILLMSGRAYTFGSRAGVALSTSITSRTRYRKSTDLNTDTITVSGGAYQLRVGGVWQTATAAPGTWGTATAISLIGTSSGSYATSVEVTGTIDGVADVFTIITRAAIIPRLVSFTTDSTGLSHTAVFSAAMQVGAGGNGGWVIDPDIDLTFVELTDTVTATFTTETAIEKDAVVTVSYVQPGNGFESTEGGDLASIASAAVVNNSEYEEEPVSEDLVMLDTLEMLNTLELLEAA